MTKVEAIRQAIERGDGDQLATLVPFAKFMGITMDMSGDELIGHMKFADHIIGNARLPALHGGALGTLLESTAIFKLLWKAQTVAVPKTVNITVEYLRSGKAIDTYASASFTKLGRRVANVRAYAWQDDRDKPIAAANAHFLLTPDE